MKQVSTARSYKGNNVRINFATLTDEDIQLMIEACEVELELRSQESMMSHEN